MQKWLLNIVICLVGVTSAAGAFAQQPQKPAMRAQVIVDKESGAKVTRPEGWVSAQKTKGVVAVFRAAGDSKAQIEVRVSPHVKAKQRQSFFASFQTSLQKSGFVKQNVNNKATYGGKTGVQTEYEATSKASKFRLILWQFHHGDSAILVVGFFPASKRDKYFPAYKQVIEKLTFQ